MNNTSTVKSASEEDVIEKHEKMLLDVSFFQNQIKFRYQKTTTHVPEILGSPEVSPE